MAATFPKTMAGAVVAGAFRTKPHLGPKQVNPDKGFFRLLFRDDSGAEG